MTDGIINTWTMGHLQGAWLTHGRHPLGGFADKHDYGVDRENRE